MTCKCGSNRIIKVGGKVSDMFSAYQRDTEKEHDGYVPGNLGIGAGDYIEFAYCLDCGQIQEWEGPAGNLGDEEE